MAAQTNAPVASPRMAQPIVDRSHKKPKETPAGTVLAGEKTVFRMAWSPDGKWIAATHLDAYLDLWDATTGRLAWRKRAGGNGMPSPHSVTFSPDSTQVASGSSTVKIFAVADGSEKPAPAGHPKGELHDIAWTVDGIVTASGKQVKGADHSVAAWSPAGDERARFESWRGPDRVAFVPGNPKAVIVCGRYQERWAVGRIELATGKTVALREIEGYGNGFAVTPNGVWLTTSKGSVDRLDLEALATIQRIEIGADRAYTGDADSVITGTSKTAVVRRFGLDGTLLATWTVPPLDLREGYEAALLAAGKEPYLGRFEGTELCAVAIAPAGDRIAFAVGLAISVWTTDGKPLLMPWVAPRVVE